MTITVPIVDVGDLLRIGNPSTTVGASAFTNATGAATDPTVVELRVRRPSGVVTVYVYGRALAGAEAALTKEAGQTGRFYADVSMDTAEAWYWRLSSTGAVQAAHEGSIWVRPSMVV